MVHKSLSQLHFVCPMHYEAEEIPQVIMTTLPDAFAEAETA